MYKTIEQFCTEYPWYYPLKLVNNQLVLKVVYNPNINRVRVCKPEYSFTGEFLGYTFETIRKAYYMKSTNILKVFLNGKTFTTNK